MAIPHMAHWARGAKKNDEKRRHGRQDLKKNSDWLMLKNLLL
jgi:hypothetical protein